MGPVGVSFFTFIDLYRSPTYLLVAGAANRSHALMLMASIDTSLSVGSSKCWGPKIDRRLVSNGVGARNWHQT